jgi:hypothetical protein
VKRLLFVGLAAGCIAAAAAAAGPPDIPQSYLFSPAGKLTPLHPGTAYQASQFPVPLRVNAPEGGWGGAQWKANQFSPEAIRHQHLTCGSNPKVCAPPYYGWVTIGTNPSTSPPRGLVVILSSFSPTPSVATTAARLCRTRSVACQSPSPVTIAGFHGLQLDGETRSARGNILIPFTDPSLYAGKALGDGSGDAIWVDGAHPFRATVLDVRGKTVVVFVGSPVLSPDQFAAFLPKADRLLGSLRFSKGG